MNFCTPSTLSVVKFGLARSSVSVISNASLSWMLLTSWYMLKILPSSMPPTINSRREALARLAESSQFEKNWAVRIGTLSVFPSTRTGLLIPVASISVAGAAFVGLIASAVYLRRNWGTPGGWVVFGFLLMGWAVLAVGVPLLAEGLLTQWLDVLLARAGEGSMRDSLSAFDQVRAFAGDAIVTEAKLASGSDRVAAALALRDRKQQFTHVVNLQGDLPSIDGLAMQRCLAGLTNPGVDISTIAAEIKDEGERDNPNVVKAVAPLGPGREVAFARDFVRRLCDRRRAVHAVEGRRGEPQPVEERVGLRLVVRAMDRVGARDEHRHREPLAMCGEPLQVEARLRQDDIDGLVPASMRPASSSARPGAPTTSRRRWATWPPPASWSANCAACPASATCNPTPACSSGASRRANSALTLNRSKATDGQQLRAIDPAR